MFREHQKAWEQLNYNIIRVWSTFVLSETLAFACLKSSYIAMVVAAYSETSEQQYHTTPLNSEIRRYKLEYWPMLRLHGTLGILCVMIHGIVVCMCSATSNKSGYFNPLNSELNPICYLLALLGAHHFLHVTRIRVKLLTLRRLMSYIYIYIYIYIWSTHSWCF